MLLQLYRLRYSQMSVIRTRFLFLGCILSVGFASLYAYVSWMLPVFILGIAAISASAYKKPATNRKHYLILATLLLLISFFIPVKALLYFSFAFIIFFWVETYYASIGFLGFSALILSSPVFEYAASVFSFPLRLQITKWVGQIFSMWQKGILVRGNIIIYEGQEFSVDPACMGLHMLSISMLLGIIMLGILQRKTGKVLPFLLVITYLTMLFFLNAFANFIRIIVLVQFSILPGTAMHELAGLICMILYVCLPASLLARVLIRKGRLPGISASEVKRIRLFFPTILLMVFTGSAVHVHTTDTYNRFNKIGKQQINSFSTTQFSPGIVKLENDNALVYVKFIRGFYDTEHNPTICWKGSGYEFREVKIERIGNNDVFTAQLAGNNEILYTAWWYGNGTNISIDQWYWRWDMMKGARNYAVINVTAADRTKLGHAIHQMTNQKLISPLFDNL